ncbi:MAG: serine/threonine protein kinase [Polyangiaceae bacterium]|nr:serine/threonine protein kinase [Polyangiaceae bacterium]
MTSLRSLGGGRYSAGPAIASGGMATVHLARQIGPVGHSRVVALKCLKKELARDPEFVAMLLDEARLTTRVRHSNVVPLLDVVAEAGELTLVLEYVPGVPLSWLALAARDAAASMPTPVVVAIGLDLLDGLHAVHEARDDRGRPLEIIHRDVSPQNVLVGEDGTARLLDLGVAKAARRAQTTRGGELKGKLAYMPPEQLELRTLDRRADVYSAAVVLWELCAGRRLHDADGARELLDAIAAGPPALSALRPLDDATAAIEVELRRALCHSRKGRHASALELGQALQQACPPAPRWEVREWVARLGRSVLDERATLVRSLEVSPGTVDAAQLAGAVLAADTPTERAQASDDSQTGVTAHVSKRVTRAATHPAVAVALVVAGFLLHAVWRAFSAPPPDPRPAAAVAAQPTQSVAAQPTQSVPNAPGVRPPSAPSAPAPAPPPAAPTVAKKQPARAAPAAVSAPSARPAPCHPPYRIDAAGVRVFKEECL